MGLTQNVIWFNWKRKIFYCSNHSCPSSSWKEILRNYTESINNLVIQDHYFIKKHQIFSLNNINSATLYETLNDANKVKPTSKIYFGNVFPNFKPDWKSVCLLPRLVTLVTNLRMFQYKFLNNILCLNNMLFRFKKIDSPLFSHCNEEQETPIHLFHSCLKTKQFWKKLRQHLSQFINIAQSAPHSSIVGIFQNNQHSVLMNHVLLIYKFYIYSARNTKQLKFDNLKKTIKKIKVLENKLTGSNKLNFLNKWRPIDHIIDWYSILSKKEGRAGVINLISSLFWFVFLFFLNSFSFFFCPFIYFSVMFICKE